MENSEDYQLTFPIINKHLHISRLYKVMKYITIIIVMINLILLIIVEAQKKGILYTSLNKALTLPGLIICACLILITLTLRFTLKRFDTTGQLIMLKDSFVIEHNETKNIFDLKELRNFTIILNYSSYSPSMFEIMMFGTWIYWFGFYTGTGNYLQFYHKDNYYRIEIYLQGVSQINLFKARIKNWHQENYHVRTITD